MYFNNNYKEISDNEQNMCKVSNQHNMNCRIDMDQQQHKPKKQSTTKNKNNDCATY